MQWDHVEDFDLDGFRFRLDAAPDYDIGPPWDHEDGHGPVREARGHSYYSLSAPRDKRPGERVLRAGWPHYLLYDWQEAVRIAKRDGWGIDPERRAQWEARIGRPLTPGMIAEAAVKADFDRLRAWCAGNWYWVCLRVTLLDVEGEPVDGFEEYLGGVESDSEDYMKDCARELAAQIAAQVRDRIGRKKYLVIEQPARVERIRLRA